MGRHTRQSLLEAFRRAVRDKIARDLERERAEAERHRREALPALREVVTRLRAERRCDRAWLFGSYAWGAPTSESDLDVLVETDDDPFSLAAEISRSAKRMVHVVPLRDAPSSLVERALSEGVSL